MKRLILAIFILFGAAGNLLRAQDPERMMSKADSLHRACRFQEAMSLYLSVSGAGLAEAERESLDRKIALSQNGLNMTEFCADPTVVARERFSRKDFFQFYPLKTQAWRTSPNPLDSLSGYPLYCPKESDVIYYTARDRAGSLSIFVTEDLDSLWRAPRLAGEAVLSTGSEIFPMLSPDGKTLYFASDGLFGMGGFDIYASAWDDETASWGAPVNLGFPFNSPDDDFLMMDTEDGEYTLFASNRDCSADSVYVYVLEKEPNWGRKRVRDYKELDRIVSLMPMNDPSRIDNASALSEGRPGNANTRLYVRKMEEARALRDSIYRHEKVLDALRSSLSEASADELPALTSAISRKEEALKPLRALLEETNLEIRLVEQSFLQTGVVSGAGSGDREVVGAGLSYTFSKKPMGGKLKIKVARPSHKSSFRVAPIGKFATDNALPPGLVYQIEVFSSPRHASVEDLNGLSPVTERLSPQLRYTYFVGTYSRYADALEDLNTVRCLGFPEARIVAYRDGRGIPVRTARQEE